MFRRFLTALAVTATVFSVAMPASAATWNWTDISDQLTTRTNRPVWAMAYANGSWFYTDGQDLWNGGQVYRHDGSTQANITIDVRNAGLSRVDDIVSDGQTVLFLKNMALRNNQFEVLKYQNGSYANLTSALRNGFLSDEGIGWMSGRDGIWYTVTSKGRVLKWFANTDIPTVLTLPSTFQTDVTNSYLNVSQIFGTGTYNVPGYKNGMFRVLPISGNQWLFLLSYSHYQMANPYQADNQMYRYDGSTFTDMTSSLKSQGEYTAVASNGTDALIVSSCASCVRTEGTSVAKEYLLVNNSGVRTYSSPVNLWGRAIWTGQSWLFHNEFGKRLLRVTEGIVEDLGKTRDYFVTMASNGSGTMLLGGAVSDEALSSPSSPLTAKLVKVTESGATTTPSTTTTNTFNNVDSGTGIASWAWLTPNVTTLKASESTTYSVGAWDANGLKRIEIVVNGIVRQTCELGNATGNQTCSFTLRGSDYSANTNVAFNAKVTDGIDKFSWTPLMNLAALGTDPIVTSTTPPPATGSPATWVWAIPPDTNLVSSMSTYHVGAWDEGGIARIEIWVNGTVRRVCTYPNIKANVECSWDVFASDYADGSEVFVNAKVSDAVGHVTWAASKSWRVQSNAMTQVASGSTGTNYNPNTVVNLPGSVSVTSNRDGGYTYGQTVTYTAKASDQNVLDRIELYVNAVRVKTCYNVASCSWTGGPYYNRSSVSYGATMVDKAGYALWTGYKTINKI